MTDSDFDSGPANFTATNAIENKQREYQAEKETLSKIAPASELRLSYLFQ